MSVIDQNLLSELREIMEDEFPSLLRVFLSESQAQYDRLQQALAQGDFEGVRTNAHSLKGTSGNIGASQLRTLCQTMEYAAKEAQVEVCQPTLEQITSGLNAAHQEIQAVLDG